MNITPSELLSQAVRALQVWPFIPQVEAGNGLPVHLLLAVGSRETNLTNEVGDGGHGHGVWQLDDRSHTIPPGFDANVAQQAQVAAVMLRHRIAAYGLDGGLDAYNSGRPVDSATTGGDYGPDVMGRLEYLQQALGAPTPSAPFIAAPVVDACSRPGAPDQIWVLHADGGVFSYRAPFLGSYPGLPPADRQGSRTFVAIEADADGRGYIELAGDGSYYHFRMA